MGKATRWLRSLFGAKKSSSRPSSRSQPPENYASSTANLSSDANKHAIAVAAATAAVAEAAIAAAQAAAEVVRLTTCTGGGSTAYYDGERLRLAAAVRIQSAFRACLARRALRALKGLVKLQALVRGHIVRKQSADMLRRMQAMARLQARAVANRASSSGSPHSSTRSTRSHHHPRSSSMSNIKASFRQERHYIGSNWTEETSWTDKYDDKSDKILEVDTWKPRVNPSPRNSITTPTKHQMLSFGSIKKTDKVARTAENTPRAYSASSRSASSRKRSPFTPARTGEYSRSLFGDYPSHPNFMANTESSQAKLRSVSAPRQRTRFERFGSARQPLDYSDTNSELGFRR